MRPQCDGQSFADNTVRCPHGADTTVHIVFPYGKTYDYMFCGLHSFVAALGASFAGAHVTMDALGQTHERCSKDAITFCCGACARCGLCLRCCDCRPEDLDDDARREAWRSLGRQDDGK